MRVFEFLAGGMQMERGRQSACARVMFKNII